MAACAQPYRWQQITLSAPFRPRDGHGLLSYRGRLWLLGGWNPDDRKHFPRICSNEVWASPDGRNWALVKPNTFLEAGFDPASDWEGRHTAGYAVFRDKLWVIGGDPIQGHYQNDVWSSVDGARWTRVTDAVPWGPRVLHYTVVHDGRLWVMGGQTLPQFAPAEPRFYRDIWSSRDGRHWEQVIPDEPCWPQRGMIGGRAVFGGRMWILGGGTYDLPGVPKRKLYSDVWSSVDGVHWQCHTDQAPWEPRQYHEVAVWDNRLWVMEGYCQANRNDVWYSCDGTTWQELPDTPWKPRHAAGLAVHGDSLYLVSGNNMESDVWRLVRSAGT